MESNEKLRQLREQMRQAGIDLYIVPTSDFHQSEYIGEHFMARRFLTGFTGSAGTAVITQTRAGLWTDGRYFVQAAEQLKGSGFTLFPMGEEGVATIGEFIEENLPQEGVLGFDGRVMAADQARRYEKIVREHNGRMETGKDLVGRIWEDRPPMPATKAWILPDAYSGETVASKLYRIRAELKKQNADIHVISSLTDIAWILNIRGSDIAHVPVILAFLIISQNHADLFVQDDVLPREVFNYLAASGVRIFHYDTFYETLASITASTKVWLDEKEVNYRAVTSLDPRIQIIDLPNASEGMKAVKNETELANTRIAHRKDGAAMVKFLYWLKTHVGREEITEYTAARKLDELRSRQEGFLDISFDTICAYAENGAIVHYTAEEETARNIEARGMLLVDSGGHYMEGTTDVTRTVVLGPLTEEERRHFTLVCISNLRLAHAKFLYGCTGINLDILAREPLWQDELDFKHGTGHGVGNLLNVHEGPNAFRWKTTPERLKREVLEAGMITSDEPGLYFEGKYGIRTENELACIRLGKNEYGQFMGFEVLTYVPIDLNGLDLSLMSAQDKTLLNAYHKEVYDRIAPLLDEEERQWLYIVTRPVEG